MRKNTEIMKFIKNPNRKMQERKSGNGCGFPGLKGPAGAGLVLALCVFAGCSGLNGTSGYSEAMPESVKNTQILTDFETDEEDNTLNKSESEVITKADKKEKNEKNEEPEETGRAERKDTETAGQTDSGVISGTFCRNEGGVTEYPAYIAEDGTQHLISLDLYADAPFWEGYENDVLRIVGLDAGKYRLTGASWAGDPYWGTEYSPENDMTVAVEYRDAVYSYAVR